MKYLPMVVMGFIIGVFIAGGIYFVVRTEREALAKPPRTHNEKINLRFDVLENGLECVQGKYSWNQGLQCNWEKFNHDRK